MPITCFFQRHPMLALTSRLAVCAVVGWAVFFGGIGNSWAQETDNPPPIRPVAEANDATNELTLDKNVQQPSFEPLAADRSTHSDSLPLPLSHFLELAAANHPALDIAAARVDAAKHEALQANLAPNPQLGIFADEVGNEDSAGLIGVYLQRKIIRGNKLALASAVKCRQAEQFDQRLLQQILRIETDIRTEFYRLLVAQRRVELTQQLQKLQNEAVDTAAKLNQAQETPKTDLLQTQVQAGRTAIKREQADIAVAAAWRRLATAVAFPELSAQLIDGSLNEILDELHFETVLESTLASSPERQAAVAQIDVARAQLRRELAETIPNYQTQLTVGQDTGTDDFFTGFQLQVPLLVSDRNQGNIGAARTRIRQAEATVAQVELQIARRLTDQFEKYQSAQAQVSAYDSSLLPKARETLDITSAGYQQGEVGFLQVLAAQQSLLDLTLEYLDSLETLWDARQQIVGLTLSNVLNN